MWILLLLAATVSLIARVRGHRVQIPRSDWPRFALWGLVTACHFALYIASLHYTTVAHSLALVYTSPIFLLFLGNQEYLTRLKHLLLLELLPV